MDPNGRLMMPNGFVGQSFDETGVAQEVARDFEPTNNRAARRKMEALDRAAAQKIDAAKAAAASVLAKETANG